MKTSNSEKILIAGAIIGGAYLIFKNLNPDVREASGDGSIGGSDDMYDSILAPQGFNIDPNTSYATETPVNPTDYPTAINDAEPTPIISYPTSNIIKRSSSNTSQAPQPESYFNIPTSILPNYTAPVQKEITAPMYGLGVLGLIGSYFSVLGKNLITESEESILKRTFKEGVEDIPFFGKKSASFMFDASTDIPISGAKQVERLALKSAELDVVEKATLKSIGKRGAKVGLGLIPIVGTVAGSEFDVAMDNRPRTLAYAVNIAGDVVGGVLGAVTAPLALTGIGSVVPAGLSVAGQVGTELGLYGLFDWITGKKTTPTSNTPTAQTQINIDPSEISSRFISNPQGGYLDTQNYQSVSAIDAVRQSNQSSGSGSSSGSSEIKTPVSSGATTSTKSTKPKVSYSGGNKATSKTLSSSPTKSSTNPKITIKTTNKATGKTTVEKFY